MISLFAELVWCSARILGPPWTRFQPVQQVASLDVVSRWAATAATPPGAWRTVLWRGRPALPQDIVATGANPIPQIFEFNREFDDHSPGSLTFRQLLVPIMEPLERARRQRMNRTTMLVEEKPYARTHKGPPM